MPGFPERASDALSLQDLQQQFLREVLYRESSELLSQVVANGLGAERRLAIYRTNARETFALALEAAFPLLLNCLGGEEFRRLAWTYQRACPSPAGNLFHVGARLPGFLSEHVRGTDAEHLIDVARLEWAVQESLVAADKDASLDLAALAAVPAEHQASIRFLLHPSVGLLRTAYGVFALWEAQQAGRPVSGPTRAPERLLVQRLAAGVQLLRVPDLDLRLLEALRAGSTLAQAANVLPATEQDDLGALLVRWVQAGVIVAFTVDNPPPGAELR